MPTVVTADAETYYDGDFSLRKMPTEAYILDPRFFIHCWSIKIDDDPAECFTHAEAVRIFAGIEWDKAIFVAHNAGFDAAILAWKYGHVSKMYADTIGIANTFIRPFTGRVDLDTCAKHEGLPLKSGALAKMKGCRDITPMWAEAAQYANTDNENCYHIFKKYWPRLTREEKIRLSWTTENYIRGRLRLDRKLLEVTLKEKLDERDQLMRAAGLTDPKFLTSPSKFVAHLEWLGIEVHMKDGKKGEASIPSIAKDDPFVRELLAHGDAQVVAAMKARLAFSSNLDITRCRRLIAMSKATGGKMLMPMRHHAAHTGRPGGTDGVNITNFKRANPKKNIRSPLREAVKVPPGKALVDVDASQIEARICCTLAQCKPLMEAFADPTRDPYCECATMLLDRVVTKDDEIERQIGKKNVLSSQYGVGGAKMRNSLQAEGVDVTLHTAEVYVYKYRSAYPEILGNGQEFVDLFKWCLGSQRSVSHKNCILHPDRLILPDRSTLFYPQLRVAHRELVYYSSRYKSWQKLYAGSMNENLCQAMANIIVGRVHAVFHRDVVSTVYDSVARLVDVERAQEVGEETVREMRRTPWWMPDLVLDAEYKIKTHL
jgi:hypothetical protein